MHLPELSLSSISGFTQRLLAVAALGAVAVACCLMEGCQVYRPFAGPDATKGMKQSRVMMEVTGYDSGPTSCNWTRDWLGRPVIASGPNKGKRKKVGITASGKKVHRGTVAADTRYYPFGTVLYVPGYGWGVVEDTGGDIKGPNRLDLWFSTAREARVWGRQKNVAVTIWTKK